MKKLIGTIILVASMGSILITPWVVELLGVTTLNVPVWFLSSLMGIFLGLELQCGNGIDD